MRFILLFLLFLLTIVSCEKDCIKAEINFQFINFSEAEVDTIIIRRFEKNGSFSSPLDTTFLDGLVFSRANDTLRITGGPGSANLFSEYNYQLFFPGAAKQFTITDIQENKESDSQNIFNCTKEACINSITSYAVNGQFSSDGAGFNLIYLKK